MSVMHEIAGYSPDKLVYEGAETAVYRGRRQEDGAPVAIKVTRGDYPTWRHTSRLRREASILKDLGDIEEVPRAIDLVPCGRGLALVMEDLGGASLHDLIAARGRLDPSSALKIAIPLARTLGALHRRRIVHKDVKPRNVMIDEATLAPHLVDFGIAARLAQEAQEAVAPDDVEGTLAYLAPEQTGRTNRPVDRRADLYALGATLYEMLVGAPPFSADDPAEMIQAHLTVAPTPPRARAPGVPAGLSELVLRLLAKAPEERYQSALGLAADLEECLRRLQATGGVEPFPLGREDGAEDVRWPDRVVGRDAELGALAAALGRARAGGAALAIVAGPSGIGKSTLVRELVASSAIGGASLAAGKFDPLARSVPLSALAQALRGLVGGALCEPPAALAARKLAIEQAIGSNGRLLTDLCPELELVIGPQPEPPALGPSEAKNRLALVLRRFLSTFAREGAPLVLFLDDLQWADPSSLDLLTRILGDPDARHVLVIGAYRDDEIDAAHPIEATLRALREAAPEATTVTVGPLSPGAAEAVVADALSMEPARAAGLARVAWEKTRGNPFFLAQFLRALEEDGLLRFDPEARCFAWDEGRVREAMVTDNVVTLVARRIGHLGAATRRALALGAAAGASFDLPTLAVLLERTPVQAAEDLWDALREGLVDPIGGDYRLLDAAADLPEGAELSVAYRFLHDRVREACYALLPEEERPAAHLRIGRLLLARAGGQPRDEDLLEILRHLNLGAARVSDASERMELARLDLRGARRARAATAYEAAAALFAAGRALAGGEGAAREGELWWPLRIEGAECEHLSGAFERAEALAKELLAGARSALERAEVHALRLRALMTQGRFADALGAGLEGLAALSVSFPEADDARQMAFGQGLGAVAALLVGRPLDQLAGAPLSEDPEEKAIQGLLTDLSVPAYMVSPMLYGPLNLEQVRRSLAHGHTPSSPFAYMAYGFMLGAILGQGAQGVAMGRLALAIAEAWRSEALAAKLHVVFANFAYVREPLRSLLPHLERGRRAAFETGDFNYLASTSYATPPLYLASGLPLEQVLAEAQTCLGFARRTRDFLAISAIRTTIRVIECLLGRTAGPTSLDGEGFDEAAELARLDEKNHGIALFYWHAYKVLLRLLHGDPAGALESAAEAERHAASAMGLYWTVFVSFLAALAHAALARGAGTEEARAEHVAAIAPRRAKLEASAAGAPSNFRPALLLVDAELAALSVSSARWEAVALYDQALELARESDYPHVEAMAAELAGRHLLRAGHARAARGYIVDAWRAYASWGAVAKARALAEELPDVIAEAVKARDATGSVTSGGHTVTRILGRASAGSLRDAALVLRAAQLIAGEIVLPRVVSRLMQLVLENSGAERGALILSKDGELQVEATLRASPEAIEVGLGRRLEDEPGIAQKAVLYAWRTREPLVLDDAAGDRRFDDDPHVSAGNTRSLLCLPVSCQGRPTGVLYLEHGAATGVFTAVRVELLGLLASQAAIAIENALLVEGIQAANEEVHRANARLEADVAERTRELTAANERLAQELEERSRTEEERAALQAQVLAAQERRVQELSAPLLPISDDVLVMPILGMVDRDRAARIMEVVLQGAQRHAARTLILDITGMRDVDTGVVSALLSVASALRLLGTEPLLTGVQADVARTIVGLGVDLQGLTTLSTLRAGIAYALAPRGRGHKVR